jgi:uncharacterized protein (DUF362 family)/Pyruvate/2-oxoacid:ferredoxin oxidoreductase delta subunit
MQSLVSVQRVTTYDRQAVLHAMRACLAPWGGMGAFVRPGQRVLLKPNLLAGFAPERAVTTHPAVVRAAALLAQEAGGRVVLGDSPGVGRLASVVRTAGLAPVLEETGAALADFTTPTEFTVPQHRVTTRLTLARAVAEADVIISLPKLKTHGQMVFTGALKNQYGLIPGTLKSQWHFRLQRREWLAALILDIHRTARPALAIMDGVIGMEGKGPSGGRPRHVGAILASPDLVALDTLACRLINLEPRLVPTLEAARAEGLGVAAADIQVVGADWRALCVPDFEKVSKLEDLRRLVPLPSGILNWIREHWTAKPRIVEARCTECGACEEGCPVTPAAIHPTAPERQRVDDDTCIRCYCCHEFCPNNAIDLYRPGLLGSLRLDPLARQSQNLFSRLWPGRRRPDEPGLD